MDSQFQLVQCADCKRLVNQKAEEAHQVNQTDESGNRLVMICEQCYKRLVQPRTLEKANE